LDDSEKTAEALERSKYSYIIEVPPTGNEMAAAAECKVRFVEVTAKWGLSPPAGFHPPAPVRSMSRVR
jgi:hypothetical protein